MPHIARTGWGVPTHVDRAVNWDDAPSKGQFYAGYGIRIDFKDINDDYKIIISRTAEFPAGEVGRIPRMMYCISDILDVFPSGTFGADFKSLNDGGIFYNTAKFAVIEHNWNLDDIDKFIAVTKDITKYGGGCSPLSPHSYPKVMGLDVDRVIVIFGDNQIDDVSDWQPNVDTILGDNNVFYGGGDYDTNPPVSKIGYPRFAINLLEVF
jgi:hypothetical protein